MPFSLSSEGRSFSNLFNSNEQNSDHLIIERQNLLCVFKLVVKDLLSSGLKHERLMEKEYFPLKHFFIVFEHILLHGYNGKKNFPISTSSNRKDLWPIIDLISRKSTDIYISEISISSKEMTNIRTSLGRVRAWLRLALMQKRLADYFKTLVEQKHELKDLYDNEALLLSDESIIIPGLLVGLNVLDLNLCLRETTLDYPIESVIHYSLYLQERRLTTVSLKNTHPPGAIKDPIDELDDDDDNSTISSLPITKTNPQNNDTIVTKGTDNTETLDENTSDMSYNRRLSCILDQKNYIEELNRNLQKTVINLQSKLQTFEETNKNLAENTVQQKTRIEQLEEDLTKIISEKEQIQLSYQRKTDALIADIAVERETYQKSRTGFDLMYNELKKKYDDECVSKQKIEGIYQTQLSQNSEYVESTKLMEKDIESKTLLYDRIKEENDRLKEELHVEKSQNDERERQIHVKDKENQMLRETISELETNIEQINKKVHELSNTNDTLNRTISKLNAEKTSLETDLHVEKEFQQRLQKALTNEKEKVSTLQFDIHELNLLKQDYDLYKKDMIKKQNDSENKFHEQEETIKELALKLEGYIKREHEQREKNISRTSTWMKDDDVKECCQCKKDFGPLRRKHHCRNCGQIFCEACVSTKLTLTSSTKPVRVCDECCKYVLAQCAVNNP
ncbi:unnamed protein product [Rotaria sordida]|uniref:RUN and FYVE domain-containing protein 2 n=1 Tax=Rotaria sordida TaxID=392033 RepID=A0A814TLC9_9BILA|nr:unnamed protein product [Rotaria sordida]CAF1450819.1 unnamed protein product [Rotaria sordida]